jgi:hypothetical protein
MQASTAQNKMSSYTFLAEKQQTKYAVVPVHTAAEEALFQVLIRDFMSQSTPNWQEFARKWSPNANGSTLFYKTPEQLRSHYMDWNEAKNRTLSLAKNAQKFTSMRRRLQSAERLVIAPPPIPPVMLNPRVDTSAHIAQSPATTNSYAPNITRVLHPRPLAPLPTISVHIVPTRRKERTCKTCGSNSCKGRAQAFRCPLKQ